jgi:hypothetical protein
LKVTEKLDYQIEVFEDYKLTHKLPDETISGEIELLKYKMDESIKQLNKGFVEKSEFDETIDTIYDRFSKFDK